MRCVFCRSEEEVVRTPAYMKPGHWIKNGRVFTINTCSQDREVAEQSFDTPFTDRQMIGLYKTTLEIGEPNVG